MTLRLTDARGTAAEHSTGATGRVAGFSGLFHCGSVWLCPECSSKIAAKRAAELQKVIAHYLATGGWVVLVTLTMRHHRRHPLEECLAAAGAGWQAVNSGGTWQADKAATGYAGFCRALEVTESPENGWHVHFHAVLVFNSRPSTETLDRVAEGMFTRWSRGLVKAGMPAPTREYGLDVQHLDPTAAPERLAEQSREWARYLAKGIAAESAMGVTKEAKGRNRSIRQLMRDALLPQRWENPANGEIVETVDLEAKARLHEYEQAMHGRRQLTWSTGRHDLRAAAGLDEERTDEEIAAEELDGADVATLPAESWEVVDPRAHELLSVAEREGADGARRWLDELGVEWWRPTRLSDPRRRGDRPGQVRFDPPPISRPPTGRRVVVDDEALEAVPRDLAGLIEWQRARATAAR